MNIRARYPLTSKDIRCDGSHQRTCYIGTPGQVMFRRSAIEKVSGFDTRIGPATDIDIIYRITRDAYVCYSKALVLEKRLHDRNQTDYDLAGCIKSMMRVF